MANKMPIVVSHYTLYTGYEKEVENLKRSLDRFNLKYHVEAIKTLGTWRQNSNYAAENVRNMLHRYPDDDILRVDADAIFQRYPSLFEEPNFTADVAAHVHTFDWQENELLGGTIFFRNNERVRALVDDWVQKCMVEHPYRRNPGLLQALLLKRRKEVAFVELPAEYCKIYDMMLDVQFPVIEHFQASRKYKHIVNKAGTRLRKKPR